MSFEVSICAFRSMVEMISSTLAGLTLKVFPPTDSYPVLIALARESDLIAPSPLTFVISPLGLARYLFPLSSINSSVSIISAGTIVG
jgi:hypothetical protein